MIQELTNQIAEAVAPVTAHSAMPALYAALARAQGKFKPIPKNREASIRPRDASKTPYKFRYADLEATLSAVRGPLSEEGLALFQVIRGTRLETVLAHQDGGFIVSEFEMGPWLNIGDPKNFGITVAYFRRYQVNAILCLAADDDLDESPDEGSETDDKPQRAPVTQPQGRKPAEREQTTEAAPPLSSGQLKVIRAKLKAGGYAEEKIAEEFGFDSIEAIPASRCNDVLTTIKSWSEGGEA